MNKTSIKLIVMCFLLTISIGITVYLYLSGLSTFLIVFSGIDVVMLLGLLIIIDSNKSAHTKYSRSLKRILRTYDAILVESISKPYLEGKNVVVVSNIVDLVDAQVEMRKPIYYMKSDVACDFMILDDAQALVYILKEDEKIITPLEKEIFDMGVKINSGFEVESTDHYTSMERQNDVAFSGQAVMIEDSEVI